MKHYSIAAWTDFLRGLTNESDRSEMTRHLDSPCPECGRAVALLGAVKKSQGPVEVPEAFIARARAIFPKRQSPRPESVMERLVAALTFDSLGSAAPQGARSVASSVRRLSFGAAELTVELVVDAPQGRDVVLTGVCSAVGGRVHLLEKQRVLETVMSSPFGEFHLRFEPRKGMHLLIADLPGGRTVDVPLDFLLPPKRRQGKLDSTSTSNASEKP